MTEPSLPTEPRTELGAVQIDRWIVVGLLVLVLVRAAGMMALRDNLGQDPDSYRKLAEVTANAGVLGFARTGGRTEPTAFRPPLYPLLLSTMVFEHRLANLAVGILHVVLGAITIGAVYLLACWWRLGAWSLLAAAWVACDPLLQNQASLVMTETLATLLAVCLLTALTFLMSRPGWPVAVLGGVLAALAIHCRPTFAVWIAWSWLALLICLPAGWVRRCGLAAVFAAACIIVLAPWPIRNAAYLGKPVLFTTHGGYTLLLGNNPHFYAYLNNHEAGLWDAEELHRGYRAQGTPTPGTDVESELERDRRDYQLAQRAIAADPRMFAWSSVVRLARFWQLRPNRPYAEESSSGWALRQVTAAWYLILYLLAALGLAHLGRASLKSPWLFGLLLATSFSLVHLFYWSNMRMRCPVMPVLACLAAVGSRAAWDWCKQRK